MSANPLSFFEGFISGGDFKDFFEDFKRENLSRPELLKNDAAFKARVKKRIAEEADQAISSTTNRVMSLDLNFQKVDFLNGVFDLLYDYYIEVNKNFYYFSASSDDLLYTLTYIANYLKYKFLSLSGLSQHRFFGIESSNEHVHAANNVWGYKHSVNIITRIYDQLVSWDFFSEELNQLDNFKEMCTATSINASITPLKIYCKPNKAYYIIKKMKEHLFDNLRYQDIESKKVFVDKNGKALKANNICKSNSSLKKSASPPSFVDDIDAYFETGF